MNNRLNLALIVVAVSLPAAAADDWPQFLGPNRTGESTEKGLLAEWPENGPPETWRVDCRGGLSGIAVVEKRAITMTQPADRQMVTAFDVETGEQLWEAPIAPAYRNQMGQGPRATPTVSGDLVYAFSGDGVLAAIELNSGRVAWKSPVLAEFEGKPADYGMASSPLVCGDLVVVTAGIPGATLIACDRKTGDIKWQSGTDRAGYSSAVLSKIHGQPQIVAFTGSAASAYDPATGKMIWNYPYETDYDCNVATPVVFDDHVLISSGENHGSVLLKVTKDGVKEVWQSLGPRSVLRSEWQTPIRVGDYLYGMDNVGSAGQVTHMTCVDAKTGKRVWQKLRFGKGNMTLADGKLWISTWEGKLVLVNPTPNGFEELGRKTYLSKYRQAPAISNGRLFLRDEKEMICLKISK